MTKVSRWALAAWLILLYSTLGVVRTVVDWLRPDGWLGPAVTIAFVATGALATGLLLRVSQRRVRLIAALALVALTYGLVLMHMPRAEERMHLLEYGIVALLAFAAFPGRYRFVRAMGFTLAAGWLDEGIQALLPSRMYDLRDVAFNALAGVLACASLYFVRRVGAV